MIEREYDPSFLGFILDVDFDLFPIVKQQIISVVSKMESDDQVHVYCPNNYVVSLGPGEAVGFVSNLQYYTPQMTKSIEEGIQIWDGEDGDANRYLFYIADHFQQKQSNRVDRILKIDMMKSWSRKPIKLIFCGLKECACPNIDNQQFVYVQTEPKWLSSKIQEHYQRTTYPFLISNYQPLDVEALKIEKEETWKKKK